jgi:hypothetical protein
VSETTISITWQAPTALAGLGQTVVPGRFTARFEQSDAAHVELEIAVADGRPTVDAIRIERNEAGAPLSGEELRRIPLANWVDYACAQAGLLQRAPGVYSPPGDGEEEQLVFDAVREARRRQVATDSFLQSVLAEWSRAEALGLAGGDIADHVADHFKRSTSQIYRLRKQAEKRFGRGETQ